MALKRKRPVHRHDDSSNKRHKFQSFSERIERLNIDVLRKVRPVIPESAVEDDDAYIFSYFSESVKKWRDLNLSATFTEFYKKVTPLSESLPQVIHHQETIMTLLEDYIGRQDPLALHSLLDMLVQLARDLGEDFYTKYWTRTINLLSQSVNHADFSVIEATFNTLSWLLKYLSRPLVNNITLTFEQLAPLLGKSRQKQYVRRFASEAFAFLLRRIKEPSEIVETMVQEIGENEEYREALGNTFVESMRGPGKTLHSKAVSLFDALFHAVHSKSDEYSRELLQELIKEMIYHTTNETFGPLLDKILEYLDTESQLLAIDLLLLCCVVKDGARIQDWSSLSSRFMDVIKENGMSNKEMYLLAATIITKADTMTARAFAKTVFEVISKQGSRKVGYFCELVGTLDKPAFQTFVLGEFGKYVNSADESEFEGISVSVISLSSKDLPPSLESNTSVNGRLVPKKSKFGQWLRKRLLRKDFRDELLLWRDLQVLEAVGLWSSELEKPLVDILHTSLASQSSHQASLIGKALALLSLGEMTVEEVLAPLTDQLEQLKLHSDFLEALEKLLVRKSGLKTVNIAHQLLQTLTSNLAAPSHSTRAATLRVLRILNDTANPSAKDLIEAMLEIEMTPRTVENVRSTSVAMRKLPLLSSSESDDMLVHFCFGLLTVNFAPLWNDSCGVLKSIADRSEAIIWRLALAWLNVDDEGTDSENHMAAKVQQYGKGLQGLNNKLWASSEQDVQQNLESLHLQAQANVSDSNQPPRSQSLRALLEIPQVAERHSRDLVPIFLSLESPSEDNSLYWTHKDRIALLTLFTKFINPRSLYKTDLVRSTLYTLLHKGDSKIQKLALDAILTWKEIELTTYKENLHNLLDDKKFRDELTCFFNVDATDSPIQEGHRGKLMEVGLRILFGAALVRHGSGEGKRSAILSTLANLRQEEKDIFVNLALLPFQSTQGSVQMREGHLVLAETTLNAYVEDRKMVGFVTMVQQLVQALGGEIASYLPTLLEAVIVCMWKSRLGGTTEEEPAEDEEEEFAFETTNTKSSRTTRKGSMKALAALINKCPDFEWSPYIQLIFKYFILPKLQSLADENIQSPSNRLQFFLVLSEHQQTVHEFTRLDGEVIPNVLRCLENSTAKPPIFDTALRIVSNIFKAPRSDGDSSLLNQVILPNLAGILEHLTTLLSDSRFSPIISNKALLDLISDVLQSSTPLAKTSDHAQHLIDPLLSLLDKPGRMISDKAKVGLLESILNLLPLCDDFIPTAPNYDRRLSAVSRLFSTLRDRTCRTLLCHVIDLFADVDSTLVEVGPLVADLNAYDRRRLDTPDFDRRLAGYAKLNEDLYRTLSLRAWTPVVYNLIYFVQDPEEMSLRTGAAFGLQQFFVVCHDSGLSQEYTHIISHVIFPAIKRGIKHPNELIRKEFLGVLDSMVKNCGDWSPLSDLKVLLFDGDEEANFFNNIYHVQQHRQLRAIARLSKAATDGLLKAGNIEDLFIPMLEIFSFSVDEEVHNLAAEATRGIGALSSALGWKAYRQLVKRYLSMLKAGHEKERTVVRTLCSVIEMAGKVADARKQRLAEAALAQQDEELQKDGVVEDTADFHTRAVIDEFYPPMLQYLHHHEENTLTLRVPVAIALVKALKTLPEQYLVSRLPAVLMDICHVLRSRSQEARDICRKTLNEIMTLLDPKYFLFVLKELRTALSRGYQLHVLGYTVHSILTHLPVKTGDIDASVKSVVEVLIDDVFGTTGAEKESEGYTSGMKEIKTSKSYDSFEILASITSTQSMNMCLQPLKMILYDLGNAKEVRKMSEILRRVELGILRNKNSDPAQVFEYCISIFKSIQSEIASVNAGAVDMPAPNAFIVNLKFKRKHEANHFKANAPLMLRFSLNTLAALSKKYDYLLTEERITAFVPLLGDCLMSDVDELRVASLRLLGRMISQPVPSLEEGLDVFVDRAVEFVKESPLTKSELCQASLKFLSLLIRDRKSYTPRENVVVYLFERIRPDLEEPDRQGVSFSFIRAVLSRRIIIPEVYDMMSEIAKIMVTNQSRSVRDTARALYLQFLLDYPQGRDRLKKQISFLVKNLQYEHDTGRQSVMEVLHQVVTKFGDELLQPILLDIFIGLLLPLANDDSATCREMSSRLIQSILENADDERSKAIRTMLRAWASQKEKSALLKASLHVYALLLEYGKSGEEDIELCVDCVSDIILQSTERDRSKVLWEVTEQALRLFAKLIKTSPTKSFSADKEGTWTAIGQILCSDLAGVRLEAARAIGLLFSQAKSLSGGILQAETLALPVTVQVEIARQSIEQIKDAECTVEVSLQAVKNLVFLGRHFYSSSCHLPLRSDEDNTDVKPALTWFIQRVAAEIRYEHVAAEHMGHAKKLFVQWMVAISTIIEPHDLPAHAETIIASFVRFLEDSPVRSILKSAMKETREIAEEGLKLVQNNLGTTAFLEHYNVIRQDIAEKREERRAKRALEAVNDPERAAQRKIKKHKKTMESRKRKVSEFRNKRHAFGR